MTDILCVTCSVLRPNGNPRRPNNPQVCDGCRERLSTDLYGLPSAYADVDTEPARVGGERRTIGFESRPPLATEALSLISHGSVLPSTQGTRYPQDQLGTVPPVELLWWWAEDWHTYRDMREVMPDPVITGLVSWLGNRLSWACDQHPAVDEFAENLRDVARQLRAFGGRDRGQPVGRCPRRFGDDLCGTALYVDPYVNEIECPRCRMKWRRRDGEWMHLRAQQLNAGLEVVA